MAYVRKRLVKKRLVKRNIVRKYPKKSKYSVAKLAQKVNKMSRAVEVKEARAEGLTDMVGTAVASFTGNVFCINPASTATDPKAIVINQGSGEGDRIGNQVTTKQNLFRFCAVLKPWHSTSNPNPRPMYLKAWVVSIRGGQYGTTLADATNLIKSRFFDTGNSYIGFGDNLFDTIRPVNEDVFTVHYTKVFKIGPAQTMASGGGGATPTSAQGYTNNDFKLSVKWTIPLTKYTIKNIRYNDTDGSVFNPTKWLFFTMSNADGSAVGSSVPMEMFYNHVYRFTDN